MSELKDFLNGGGSLAPQVDSNTQAIAAKYGYNFIVNGCGEVQQRGPDSVTGLLNNSVTIDCWITYNNNGTNTYSVNFTRTSGVYPLPSIKNSLKYTITAAKTPASGDAFLVEHSMESGVSSALIAKEFTVSFWVKCNRIGQRVVVLVNPEYNTSYVATFNINAADTWEFKQITITGGLPQNSNWGATLGASLRFPLSAGSGLETTTPNTWVNENKVWAAGTVDLAAQANNYLEFTGVKIELGNQATDYVVNTPETLSRCLRRYEVLYLRGIIRTTASAGTGYLGGSWPIIRKSNTPVVSYSSQGQANKVLVQDTGLVSIGVGGFTTFNNSTLALDANITVPSDKNWWVIDKVVLDCNV